jgi:peptidoglycan/LPS O-acetylase OafA/YrhL
VAPLAAHSAARYFDRIAPTRILTQIVLLSHKSIPGVFSDLPVKTVNGSLWTVPYEFVCYILLAIAGTLGFARHRSRMLALTALVWGLYVASPLLAAAPPAFWPGPRKAEVTLRFVSCFLVGATLSLYRERIALTAAMATTAVVLLFLSAWSAWSFRLAWPVCFPYVLLYVAYHPGIPLQGWGRRGDFSYGLYIYAFPIQQLLVKFAGPSLNPLALFVAAMAITVPVAIGSWFLIEKPFLRLKSRLAFLPRACEPAVR